jgi:UDP-glucose 4-epimerase
MPTIRRVLVTGGCGFIGSNLVRLLRSQTDWDVRVIDDMRTGRSENIPEGLADVWIGNAANPHIFGPASQEVDAVVHLASQTGVQPSVEDPMADFQGNAAVAFRVLDATRQAGIGRFVFASTGAAVGEVDPPIHEEVVPRPVSPYGAGKLAGEAYCRAFAASFGMDTVALRFSNVYGPFSERKKNAVPNFIKRRLTGEPMVIFGDGSQTRDFVYVDDLCGAIVLALQAEGVAGEVFQVASGVETSILDLARMVEELVPGSGEITFEPARAGEVNRSRADISKARRVLGFDPQVDLRQGVVRTAEWYREHWLPTATATE